MSVKAIKAAFRSWGGVHPRYHKGLSSGQPIAALPVSKRLLVSMAQHLGAPTKPTVKKGDHVDKGQPIGEPSGFVSSWVHAPSSGTVKNVEEMPTPSGRAATVVEIETDGKDQAVPPPALPGAWTDLPPKVLVDLVAKAGIIGMGGAGFPTHVKLSPPPGKTIDTLIINGAECEPYLTADHRLMVEQAQSIWNGAQVIRRVLDAKQVWIAIEDNKPDAIAAMEKVLGDADDSVRIAVLATEYPQGAEKQLIYAVTGREIPSGGLPMDVGALVENVGTASAIFAAVTAGTPLIQRVVTVTGRVVKTPRNILARIGTPLQDLVDFCEGVTASPAKIICGGPMMGIALPSLDVGMGKTTSGVLLLNEKDISLFSSMPCISCGRCVAACPMGLMPCTLSERIEAEDYATAETENVLDCIECGCCAFECPAHRPLVQHMKQGKAQATLLRRQRDAKKKAS